MQELEVKHVFLPLRKHIEKYHGGRQVSFARSTGKHPAEITKWLKSENTIVFCTGHVHHLKASAVDQVMVDLGIQEACLQNQETLSEQL